MAAQLSLDALQRTLDQTGGLIGNVTPDQATQPTPCPDWDVRALVNHVVYDLHLFETMLTGAERESPDKDRIGKDWKGAYDAAAQSLMESWRKRGTMGTMKMGPAGDVPATWVIGQHLSDIAVHGWDVARATNQSTEGDPDVGHAALDWAKQNLKPEFRGQAFGPEVPIADSAPLYDRLAAFFGRAP